MEVKKMNRKNFYVGMGMGVVACGCAVLAFRPRKKRAITSAVGRALMTMSEVADSISETMGW